MAFIKPRYPEQPKLQHAYTLYVFQQLPLTEISFRTRMSSADIREKAEQDGWEVSRRAVREAYEKHVGRELSGLALRHAVPFLIDQLTTSDKLSQLVHRALDRALEAKGGEADPHINPAALAMLSKVAKDASEIGHKALRLGGVGKDDNDGAASVAINVNVIQKKLDDHDQVLAENVPEPIEVDFSEDA